MLLLVFLSFAGYGTVLYVKHRIAPAVIPLFLFSSVILVLFLGGLLHVLVETAYGVFAGGLLALIYAGGLLRPRREQLSALLSPGIVFFSVTSIFFIILLQDTIFLHFDNFSHWGLIVKELFQSNSLPDESTIITYTTYPPGSALFVYYIVTFTGFSESMALIAQAVLITGALTPLFLFCSWKQPLHAAVFMFIPAVLLFVNSSSIHSLLVDPLLGYIAAAGVLTAYYYRHDWKTMSILLLPVMSALILIKDSGKIFLVFAILWMLALFIHYLRKHGKGWKENLISLAWGMSCTIFVPLFFNVLWSRYIEEAYNTSEYEDSKFAITADTLTDINKSPEFIDNLLPMVANAGFDLSSPLVQGMVLIDILAVLTMITVKRKTGRMPRSLLFTTLGTNLFYMIYVILLYLLYLFLMPEIEAKELAGFDRYQSSVVIFFTGVLMVFTLKTWMNHSRDFTRRFTTTAAAFLTGLLVLLPYTGEAKAFFVQENEDASPRMDASPLLTELRQEENISGNTRFTLINDIGGSDHGFLRHVMRYERMTPNTFVHTQCTSSEDKKQLLSDINNSGYLMVLKLTSDMQQCLNPVSSTSIDEPGLYRVKDGIITANIESGSEDN